MANQYFQRVLTDLPYVGYSLYQMFGIFFFWSFMGWILEVIDMAVETRTFQNRGFLHLPICPIYGVSLLILNILLREYRDNYVLLIIVSMILCTIVELLVGVVLQKAFNARWWDYSHMKFNYKGLICLRNTLFFGATGFVIVAIIEPRLEVLLDSIVINVGLLLMAGLGVVLFLDIMLSLLRAMKIKRSNGETYEPILLFKSHR